VAIRITEPDTDPEFGIIIAIL